MLTSFFSKSKPINFLVVGIFMILYYLYVNFVATGKDVTAAYFFKNLGLLLVYLLLMVLVNFIVKRNQVTERNTFTIVLFALFSVSFPEILKNGRVLVAGFFVLLALRRTISLKSGLVIKKKIFDAALWICVAALFFEWSLLFLLFLYLAILFYAANDYRNWMIPIFALACVFVLYTCFHLLVNDSFFNAWHFFQVPGFDFSNYGAWPILLPLSVMLGFSLWTVTDYLVVIKKAPSTMKSSLVLILAIWFLAMLVVFFSPTKNGSELLFFIIPVSIIGANYFQRKKDGTFKEVLLFSLVILMLLWPFVKLM